MHLVSNFCLELSSCKSFAANVKNLHLSIISSIEHPTWCNCVNWAYLKCTWLDWHLSEHKHRGLKLDKGQSPNTIILTDAFMHWENCAKSGVNWIMTMENGDASRIFKGTLCVWSFNVVALLRSQYYNLRLRLSKAAIRCLLLTAPGRLLALLDIWGHIWKRTV